MLINVENIKYHVNITGNGPPIICLHGFSENESTWDNIQIPKYSMIKIDLIGHGKSDKPKEKKFYNIDCIIKHLNKVIKRLELKKFSLMGYSMGGRIALAYALRFPDRLQTLILESASYGEIDVKKRLCRIESDKNLSNNILSNGIEWFEKYWSDLDIFKSQKKISKDKQNKIKYMRLNNSKNALANILMECGQGVFPCLFDNISNLSIPILYISGELDKKYNEIGFNFKRENSNTELLIIKNSGHNVHMEKSKEFQEIVNKFLKKECRNG